KATLIPPTHCPRPSLLRVTAVTVPFGCYTRMAFWPESSSSEPRVPGPLHLVLAGPSPHPRAQRAAACLADARGRPCLHGACKPKGTTNGRTQLRCFLQTFLFGMASLCYLATYRPRRQR
uniref:Transmembrane protein 254 n=1 Tax=Catagonus wagneri TaxID=51154 RepID=A0A8C3VTC6_9CETA